jgi:hypothetical protein
MFVFILAQIPLPVIIFLNVLVLTKYRRVRRLLRESSVDQPVRLGIGWWLNSAATLVFLTPSILEWRIFVQDRRWIFVYAASAMLSIAGLLLMNRRLGQELRQLTDKAPKSDYTTPRG